MVRKTTRGRFTTDLVPDFLGRHTPPLVLTQFVDFLYPVESDYHRLILSPVEEHSLDKVRPSIADYALEGALPAVNPYWRTVNVASVAERVTEIVADSWASIKRK